jgi:hypothetical protein
MMQFIQKIGVGLIAESVHYSFDGRDWGFTPCLRNTGNTVFQDPSSGGVAMIENSTRAAAAQSEDD